MKSALVLVAALVMAIPVTSPIAGPGDNPPPAYGNWLGGWGNCFVNWQRSSGGFNSGVALYRPDPSYPGGAGWMVHTGGYNLEHIDYEDVWIKLWIELYMIQTYEWSLYEIHRMSSVQGGEQIDIYLAGTLAGNHPECVLITNFPGNAQDYLEYLHFINNVAGYTGDERDIPITWRARFGTGLIPGQNQTWPPGGGYSAPIDPEPGTGHIVIPERVGPCDMWYEFWIKFHLEFHEPDGYYELHAEGCPNPEM